MSSIEREDVSPLMQACRQGDTARALELIANGANINAQNRNGTTPLMYAKTAAFGSGDLTIMKALIDAGVNVSAKDKVGLTALDYTIANSQKIISLLQSQSK